MSTAIIIEHPDEMGREDVEQAFDAAIECERNDFIQIPATGAERRNLDNSLQETKAAVWWGVSDIVDRAAMSF